MVDDILMLLEDLPEEYQKTVLDARKRGEDISFRSIRDE